MLKLTGIIRKVVSNTFNLVGSRVISTSFPKISPLSKYVTTFKRPVSQSMKFRRIQYGFSQHSSGMELHNLLEKINFQNNQSKQFFIQAVNQIELDNIDNALLLMRKSFSLEPTNYLILYEIAQFLFHSHPNITLELLEEILRLDQNNTNALFGLTVYQYTARNYEAAIKAMDRYLAVKPEDTFIITLKSNIAALLGNHEQIIQKETEAIRLNPNNSSAYASRGGIYKLMSLYQEAIQDFKRAFEIESKNQNKNQQLIQFILIRLSESYLFSGLAEKALETINFLNEIFQENQNMHLLRGIILVNLRRFKEALDDLQQCKSNAISIDDQLVAYFNRGVCKLQLGRPEEAVEQFNVGIENQKQPEQISKIFEHRGLAYYQMGLPELVSKNKLEYQQWMRNYENSNKKDT